MATEVLRPQDVLVERFRVHTTSYARRRNCPPPTALALHHNQQRERRPSTKKRSDAEPKKSNHGADRRRMGEIEIAMGRVTLLRRGESLDSIATKLGDSNPRDPIVEDPAAIRARSDSELVLPKKVRKAAAPPPPMVDSYAGAAFESSPSPRCLPQPSFVNNKKGGTDELFDGGASESLRRMLRLE